MIHVDHLKTSPTVAEPESDYSQSKLATDLAVDDVVALDYRGWGTLFARVAQHDVTRDEDGEPLGVYVWATDDAGHTQALNYNPDDRVVVFPTFRKGQWR